MFVPPARSSVGRAAFIFRGKFRINITQAHRGPRGKQDAQIPLVLFTGSLNGQFSEPSILFDAVAFVRRSKNLARGDSSSD
jgi:hypothetical protein